MTVSLMNEDVTRMRRILVNLLDRSESDGCVVCDSGGYVLAQEGRETQDPLLLSALGAGVFAASRELARMLGEDEFSAVFHQGERKSILIRAVNSEVLLVIIFSRADVVGLVRMYASPAADELRRLFHALNERGADRDHPERRFVLTEGESLFGPETSA